MIIYQLSFIIYVVRYVVRVLFILKDSTLVTCRLQAFF